MKIKNLLVFGVLSFVSMIVQAGQRTYTTAELCTDDLGNRSRTPYLGTSIDMSSEYGVFHFPSGALTLRPDGALVLYPTRGSKAVELGQASPIAMKLTNLNPLTQLPGRMCANFHVALQPGVELNVASVEGPVHHCWEENPILGSLCKTVTRTLEVTSNKKTITTATCRDDLVAESGGYGRSEKNYNDPTSCNSSTFAETVHSVANAVEWTPLVAEDLSVVPSSASQKLIYAAKTDQPELAEQALNSGAAVETKTVRGSTALAIAAAYGSEKVFGILASHGARTDQLDIDNNPIVTWPTISRNFASIMLLSTLGADLNASPKTAGGTWSPVNMMISAQDTEVVEVLLTSGANVDLASLDTADGQVINTTPLSHAVALNDLSLVRMILNFDPNLEAVVPELGGTALMLAAGKGSDEIVQKLLAAGANPNTGARPSYSHFVESPLVAAYTKPFDSQHPHLSTMKLLLDAGARANASNSMMASAGCWVQDPSTNTMVNHPGSILLMAAKENEIETVKLLLEYPATRGLVNAKPDCQDGQGHTPLYFAEAYKYGEMAALLRAAGGISE